MPHTDYAVATYYLIATAEASSNLARYDGVRYGLRVPGGTLMDMYRNTRGKGFGAEVKRRIMLGTYALSAGYYDAYYLKAQKVRALIARDFAQAFEQADVLVTPTSPVVPFRLGERVADPLAMYLADILHGDRIAGWSAGHLRALRENGGKPSCLACKSSALPLERRASCNSRMRSEQAGGGQV